MSYVGEYVFHVDSAASAKASEAAASEAAGAVEAELVVLLTLLVIRENGVSLRRLLKLLLRLFLLCIALVALTVRVILDGYLTVCLLYVCGTGVLVQAKHLIVISFCHDFLKILHSSLFTPHSYCPTATLA